MILLLSVSIISCKDNSSWMVTPASVPFNTGKTGEVANIYIKINKEQHYSLSIKFYYNENTVEESRRVANILGAYPIKESGKWVQRGMLATFRVCVSKEPGNEIILYKDIKNPVTNAGSACRIADLAEIKLEKGKYIIKVDYVSGSKEYSSLPAAITFSKAYHGK